MGRKEKDNYSTTSMASKASGERARKPPRFSLQRIFYRAGRPPSFTSTRSSSRRPARSTSEIEARSTTSIQSSNAQTAPQISLSISLDDSNSSVSTSPPNPIQSEARDCHSSQSGDSLECPLCLSHQPSENFPIVMTCHHRSCKDCLQQYLRIEITESRVNIACPECAERFHPNDIQMILENAHLMHKYEEFMMRRILVTDPDTRWCPAPDCGYAVIATGCASCPKLKCERPSCDTYFCYHCKQYWHPNQTCDAARAERSSNLRSSSITCSFESSSHNDIKPCPRCGAFIVKMDDGSCNHMTCAVCGAEFCWLCMKEISDLHYLSPSGCTFWGKKPWSRKKKILWQLGTLVGAPVGISLIAGISVPAIIIGVPVYVGRKLHAKYQYSSKHKRNLIVTGGVTASIVLSPVLAGIAVGIGVPILLAYVYGVVPISLCRSGGCGVTTNEKGGVRFEFDEEVEGATGTQASQTQGVGDSQSVETTTPHHVANPSIGPSIGEMSLGMTASLSASGSHLERVGGIMLREDSVDRDSASNRALAGASLNGSLCGSAGATAYHHRLEVHADMSNTASNHKRNSLSSESANLSLDAKSATVSFGDNASTKALAGSICAPREKDGASVILPPLEVQVDVSASTARYQPTVQQAPPSISASTNTMPVTERADPQQDSPSASRSVNFLNEVASSSAAVSKHYCQRQSVSVGDSLHVEPQKKLHRAEVCSFTGPDVAIAEGRSGPSCVSVDSVLTVNRTAGRRGLVEVENDRRLVSCSSSTDSNSSDMTMESTCSVHKPVCGSFRGSGCCMHGPAMSGSVVRGAMGGSTSSSCGSSVGPDTPLIVTGVSSNSSTS